MPANDTHARCVNPCPLVFVLVGISIQKPVESYLDKNGPVALKTWSCLVLSEGDMIVKLRASILQADKGKMTVSVLMGFVFIATLCLKHWVPCTTFVPVQSCFHLSLKKISIVAVTKDNSMDWDKAVYRKNVSLSLKCESVSGGEFTTQPLMSSYMSEKTFFTDDHLQNTNT